MKSLIIGISRPGDADNVLLSPDEKYVSRCGSRPEVTFFIDCKQLSFYENIQLLRYVDGDPSSSAKAISFFEKLMSKAFHDLKYLEIDDADNSPYHIRLITTPMELAQLPFEFISSPANSDTTTKLPLLANPQRLITLTREVLQESEARYMWPKQPRILFAWAQPSADVPHEEHKNALLNALKPLVRPKKDIPQPEPDTDGFLTELQNASLKSIKEEILKGISEGNPYSHIHILAHGGNIQNFTGIVFRLLLCNDDPRLKAVVKANGTDLINAIIPDKNKNIPVVVTLSSCDSANAGNVMVPSGSLVYQLQREGIPCVFASQFPLTQEGSIDLVKSLYNHLVNACDPREALYHARIELRKNGTHDWASLVAYARFPDDINEQLHAIQLKMLFSTMKTTGVWVDHVLKYKDALEEKNREPVFIEIEGRLENSITELSKFLTADNKSTLETDALRSEHLGLLGSAYKRKAEFLYRMIEFNPQDADGYVYRSTNALKIAKDFYYGGYDADDSNHWTAMQYLSLKAVLGESLEAEEGLWNFILFIAKRNEEKAIAANKDIEKMWAWGTLAELYLLKPLTLSENKSEEEILSATAIAKRYIIKIAEMGKENKEKPETYNSEKESTIRQLERYIYWWPKMIPSATIEQLKLMATELRKELPDLNEII